MSRVLLTGMSGAGKTTVLHELRRRGWSAVDTDYGDWKRSDRTWDPTRVRTLLAGHDDLVVSGTVENQGDFYDSFAHVVLLSAPLPVLLARVAGRTDNPYGTSEQDRAEIAHHVSTVQPLLRRGATLELDATRPVGDLADTVESLLAARPRSADA